MADPGDLLRAWQEVIRQIRSAAAPLTGPSADLTRQLLAPLQRQAELVEQTLLGQAEFQREIADRVLAPVNAVLEALEQTSTAMRTQAQAFDAAAASFKQASDLLELQASLIERATGSIRDPAAFVRSAGGLVRGKGDEGEEA